MKTGGLLARLMSWVSPEPNSGCWLWTGTINRSGYPDIGVNGKTRRGHRVMYEAMIGPIPPGLLLDHLCRTPSCVNPAHLEPVTCRENVKRGMGRSAVSARTNHCLNGHEFTPENTYPDYRNGKLKRKCRACNSARGRLTFARKESVIVSRKEADTLLSRWMAWASTVAFKSTEGESLVIATDEFLSRPETSPGLVYKVAQALRDAHVPPRKPRLPTREDLAEGVKACPICVGGSPEFCSACMGSGRRAAPSTGGAPACDKCKRGYVTTLDPIYPGFYYCGCPLGRDLADRAMGRTGATSEGPGDPPAASARRAR